MCSIYSVERVESIQMVRDRGGLGLNRAIYDFMVDRMRCAQCIHERWGMESFVSVRVRYK